MLSRILRPNARICASLLKQSLSFGKSDQDLIMKDFLLHPQQNLH
jgi:hypothetical protein